MTADPDRLLVWAPSAGEGALSPAILANAGVASHLCAGAEELGREIDAGVGAIVLAEEVLARANTESLAAALARQPSWSDVPILLLAASQSDPGAIARALDRLGNVTVLERPLRVTTIVSALRTAIRARRRQYELRNKLIGIEQAEAQVRALNERLRTDLGRMSRLHQVSTRLVQAGDLSTLLDEILEAALEITGSEKGTMQLADNGVLKIGAHRGFDAPFLQFFATVREDTGASGRAMQTGERVVVEDAELSPIFAGNATGDALRAAGVRAVQSTPILSRSGRLVGMLSTHYGRPGRPEEGSLRMLDLLARQAADFIERGQGEEALKEADRRKDEFLATLAHELRNPLVPISNALEIMRLAEGNAALAEQARAMMEQQLKQMVRLIDDLLDVSRITRGKLELRKERVDLASVVKVAVDTARPLVERAGHRLTISLAPYPVHLDADPLRLSQVISNLLNNAAKYMKRGGHIWLNAAHRGNEVSVTVRDNGIGIPNAALPFVFEPFKQVHRSAMAHAGGLGIGLTLSKRLVEMHGGTIEARSEGEGRGAAFIVRLPAVAAAALVLPQPARGETRPRARIPCRILVADDNKAVAESMGVMLRLMDYEVRTVNDGLQAVEQAGTFRPNVVLLDIGMPGMDGYEAARRIREKAWSKEMVLVALTGWGQAEDKRRAAEAGFDRFFTKPLQAADLEGLVLDLHGGERAAAPRKAIS